MFKSLYNYSSLCTLIDLIFLFCINQVAEKQEWKEMAMVLQIEKTISSAVADVEEGSGSLLYENACHLIHQSIKVCVCLMLDILLCIWFPKFYFVIRMSTTTGKRENVLLRNSLWILIIILLL